MNIGGVFGYIGGVPLYPISVENCGYEEGDITAEQHISLTGSFSAGGFAGYIGPYIEFSNCRSLAGKVSADSTAQIDIGGFAGASSSTITDCYALTDVSSTGSAAQYTGGLVGNAAGGTISRCYAGGSVHAVSSDYSGSFYTGGLVGTASGTSISDSYALGDVLADKTNTFTAAVLAGGFVGNFSTGGTIEHCFAAGTVTAQSAGSGALFAGGLVANAGSSTTLQHNAVFGGMVTVIGSGTSNIGRVYGAAGGTTSDNYALKTTRLYTNTTPNISFPNIHTDKDGADAIGDDFRTSVFWNTDLGFPSSAWDFSNVWSRGYPVLKNVGGQ
jgi:hypothetical protein